MQAEKIAILDDSSIKKTSCYIADAGLECPICVATVEKIIGMHTVRIKHAGSGIKHVLRTLDHVQHQYLVKALEEQRQSSQSSAESESRNFNPTVTNLINSLKWSSSVCLPSLHRIQLLPWTERFPTRFQIFSSTSPSKAHSGLQPPGTPSTTTMLPPFRSESIRPPCSKPFPAEIAASISPAWIS
jgi:hypothetical protein